MTRPETQSTIAARRNPGVHPRRGAGFLPPRRQNCPAVVSPWAGLVVFLLKLYLLLQAAIVGHDILDLPIRELAGKGVHLALAILDGGKHLG